MSETDDGIDWYVVKAGNGKALGALGFIDDEVVVITSFFDDKDANRDGSVSIPERVVGMISPFGTKGQAVMEVAMAARFDMDVLERDPSFYNVAIHMWLNFSRNLVIDGAYAAWFSMGVGQVSGAIAKTVTKNLVKQFVIKKGMESTVKYATKKSMGRD
ncbi:MAG TPA: hypothetical protein VFG30_03875 [Polyangiales bacterium]|jgi:hypothetical protein|nr:hypothetical protein [Polyangiales bacterium]